MTKQNFATNDAPQQGASTTNVVREARIIALTDPADTDDLELREGPLPDGATLLVDGASMEDFDLAKLKMLEPNVIFVSHPTPDKMLAELLRSLPSLEWINLRCVGISHIMSPELQQTDAVLTNAKGLASAALSEFALLACGHFAKNVPRLMRQKDDKNWEKFPDCQLRGATMGIVGYGGIGRACAGLAKAYGMRVVALRRRPELSADDPLCDAMYSNKDVAEVVRQSDYVVISAPLTAETEGLVSREVLGQAKKDAVIINVGRGQIIDEEALIDALRDGSLKGAALDVTNIEPLPAESPLWSLDNVLLSPHNIDKPGSVQLQTTKFFLNDQLPRFISGSQVTNVVDIATGY